MKKLKLQWKGIYALLLMLWSVPLPAQFPLVEQISSNFITSFAEDPKGYIWIGTNHGLNRFSGSNYTVYYAQEESTALNSDYVDNLMFDANNRLWMSNECGLCVWEDGIFRHPQQVGFNPIGRVLDLDNEWLIITDRKGVVKVNKQTLKEEKYYLQPGMSIVGAITISSQKQVWTANARHHATDIYILDRDLNLLRTLNGSKDTYIESIVEDASHHMWVTTSKGLLCYDAKTWEELLLPTDFMEATQNKKIHFVLPYWQNFLLIGISGEGMYRYDVARRVLTRIHVQQQLKGDRYVCFIDTNNGIWLSDQENDFHYYPEKAAFNNLSSIFERLEDPFVKNLLFDYEGYLWMRSSHDIASYDIGGDKIAFHLADGGLYGHIFIDSKNRLWVIRNRSEVRQYAIREGKIVREENHYTFPANVFSISEDKEGRIWVTLADRFATLAADGKFTYRYAPGSISFSQLQTLRPSGTMILYTVANGIYKFGEDQQFIPLDSLYLPNPNSLIIDRNNTYWIGTYNTGLVHYDPRTQWLERFDLSSGLIDNSLKAVIEDKEGNIWFSSSTHIGKYDVQEKTFSYLYDNYFCKGKLYALNCAAVAPDGTLFFGGSGGITVIYPDVPIEKEPDIPLNLDMILVNGGIHNKSEEKLSLSYRENTVTFYYSALKLEAGSLLNYAYMLEGFDKNWIDAGSNKRVAYSNLPTGKYTFKVKARILSGEWCKNELTKEVVVHPAPWATPLVIVLYWLVGIGLVLLVIRLIIRWRTQEERLALVKYQREINQAHIDFVTNISHEVRTPLAMVYAPLKELAKENNLNEHERGLVDIMLRNADRLLRLVKQLLDPKEGEKDEKQLRVAVVDPVAFVQAQIANFRFIAHEKGLTINMHAEQKQDTVACFDTEKVEKIFYNLLSNAIKYTPEGGSIDITVESDGKNVQICVADTGQGILPEKQKQLFDRFERLGADKKYPNVNGKGIGLNYAQYLAHLHKGNIDYTSKHPQGACFTLSIPQSLTAYSPEERAQDNEYKIPIPAVETNAVEKVVSKENTLFIVEDDQEVREYLRVLLSPDYNVVVVENGEEAIDRLEMELPELIVSDVVMPRKDGYELCKTIKTSADWGRIPVILLTAKNDMDSSIKGLDCGADAYVGKPFDPFYLKAVINNLLENRKRMQWIVQNLTSESLPRGEAREAILNEQNRQFLENLHTLLDKHLDDEAFGITSLAKEMLMSYSSLYARVKSLTGQTPQNFLITYRMNTAMQLLQTGKYTVSEVCYKVGASSLANFSRSFKRQFGVPPSEV